MREPNLEKGLQSLYASLRRLQSLLAWEQLKHAEAGPGQPPAFPMYDPTETDLRNEFSFFIALRLNIHAILNDRSIPIPATARASLRRRLAQVEQEAYHLQLYQRFGGGG